jgi:radial spoke head protein 4A
LESSVITNPHFPGKEKHLLRAQIARITFSTQIVPLGIFKTNEEDPKEIEPVEQDENWKAPGHPELSKL